jgi:hypothetical protein
MASLSPRCESIAEPSALHLCQQISYFGQIPIILHRLTHCVITLRPHTGENPANFEPNDDRQRRNN